MMYVCTKEIFTVRARCSRVCLGKLFIYHSESENQAEIQCGRIIKFHLTEHTRVCSLRRVSENARNRVMTQIFVEKREEK